MLRRLQKAEDALRFPPEALLEKWMENELYDLEMLVDHLTRTYSHFSDGRISKPNTLPEEVFRVADDLETERWNVWLGDELQSVQIDRDVASSRLERVDAYWGERCEGAAPGGDSDHGPVEYTDVEGVPLCAECWAKLVAEVQVETEPEPPEAATADGERVSTEQADSSLAWLCDHLTATPDGIEVALHHQRLRAFIAQEAGR